MTSSLLSIHGLQVRQGGSRFPPVDLRLRHGELLCLSGASGSGKTLLLRAVADLDPAEGELTLEGVPRSAMTGPAWRRRVAYVPAESAWWARRPSEHFRCSEAALNALGLSQSTFDREIARLSTGERQRFALLRMLSLRPRALLLDEPTAALDEAATLAAERLLRDYLSEQGAAAIWVSHDSAQIARIADSRCLLRDGRLSCPPAEDSAA